MAFFADTDALIIDLRQNGGGDPAMVALLCSYLMPAEPQVQLIDFYFRPDNSHTQSWTLPYVPGKRYLGKEVYLLTAHYTFSGAEEFAYDLQNLKRATLVGETTGGGAHPGDVVPVEATVGTGQFSIFVPTGSPTSPITKTNWEGVGVKPDVAVSASAAQDTAYRMALTKLRSATTDETARRALDKILGTVKTN